MARIRFLKPEFFKHPELGELPIATRYFFAGLWCQADKEGRLKDRPKVLAIEILPWDHLDAEKLLAELDAAGFIQRYEVDGERYISIRHFRKHQRPHPKEAESENPAPPPRVKPAAVVPHGVSRSAVEVHGAAGAVKQNGESVASKLDSGFLVLDSGSLDSGVLILDSGKKQKLAQGSRKKPRDTPVRRGISAATWEAYSAAYKARYRVEPVRNAKINGQLVQVVQRLGEQDAPEVAAFYVSHNLAFYVSKGHSVGALLNDAEKLRTEWATGRQVTTTQARQTDRTQSNLEAIKPLLRGGEV